MLDNGEIGRRETAALTPGSTKIPGAPHPSRSTSPRTPPRRAGLRPGRPALTPAAIHRTSRGGGRGPRPLPGRFCSVALQEGFGGRLPSVLLVRSRSLTTPTILTPMEYAARNVRSESATCPRALRLARVPLGRHGDPIEGPQRIKDQVAEWIRGWDRRPGRPPAAGAPNI